MKYLNKKAITLAPEALIRFLGTVLLLILIVFPIWDNVSAYIKREDYKKSLEKFVQGLNKMSANKGTFTVALRDKSAMIGFSKNAQQFECFGCAGASVSSTTIIKPSNDACGKSACICLCSGDFSLKQKNSNGKVTVFRECATQLFCKSLDNLDIVDRTYIISSGAYLGNWKGGFLYVNGLGISNGLQTNNELINTLVVEKKDNFIGVCNYPIMEFHKRIGFENRCIIGENEVGSGRTANG